MSYPLDIEKETIELQKYPNMEHGVISEPCVVLTNKGRVAIAEFTIHQDNNGKIWHCWHQLTNPRLNDDKDGVDFDNAVGIDVVQWQFINFFGDNK